MAEDKKAKGLQEDQELDIDSVEFPSVDTRSFLDQELESPLPPPPPPAEEVLGLSAADLAPDASLRIEAPEFEVSEAPLQTEISPNLTLDITLPESPGDSVPSETLATAEGPADLFVENSTVDLNAPVSEDLADLAFEPSVESSSPSSADHSLGKIDFGNEPSAALDQNPEDLSTLKRYSSLKDREAREKEAAVHVLRRQIEQLELRLQKSETERRRLTLAAQETESTRKALEEAREQDRHALSKMGDQHQEELRALQLRLDNSQFQATKAEKKLDEFRERVRNDIQKIRIRERELANRLELQKRDAEALLAAKDERLLQQKREIDRLEFEIETLQDRLIEETHRAEDRSQRLSRALQSLKLAEGLLAGIEEEVLPNSGEGEAA